MVQISKTEKNKILYALLMEGVIVLKKEFDTEHPELKIANIKIWVLLRKMKCQNYVNLTFNWRHYYYTLNSDGIKNIKEQLGITEAKVQPKTRNIKEPEYQKPENRTGRREQTQTQEKEKEE